MNSSNKTITSILLLFVFFAFAEYATAQHENKNCFEVKYLDFFGLDKIGEIKWSDEEINELLEMDYEKEFRGTRFYIPILVYQLKDFHPACNKTIDIGRFNKFVSLYSKVTLLDDSYIKNKSIEGKLNFIREDFYRLVQIEDLLPLMRFTFDDGPLYGEIPKVVPNTKPLDSVNTDFGKLSIVEFNKKTFLIASDKKNKIMWSRIVKGVDPDSYLSNLRFDKNPIENTSLAYIIHLYAGERLTLFLKPNGKFMYYYYSW